MSTPHANSSTDSSAATRAGSRGTVITIYREQSCPPDDIYHHGSEDEDYDHPESRLRNCEDAAQRYLSGHAPLLISAALRGPFNKETGWLNPWRSKGRTLMKNSTRQQPHLLDPSPLPRPQRRRSSQMDESTAIPDSLNCHLPSPESLKQAPFTEPPHPFLRQGQLATVQRWRSGIQSASPAVDNHVPTDEPQAEKARGKRKRGGTAAADGDEDATEKRKRRKGKAGPSRDASTSERSRSVPAIPTRGSTIPESSLAEANNESADGLPLVSVKKEPGPIEGHETVEDSKNHGDELGQLPAMPSCIKTASPSKRSSPGRKSRQLAVDPSANSDDELSPEKRAAATLSSPVSQKSKPEIVRKRREPSTVKSTTKLSKHKLAKLTQNLIHKSDSEAKIPIAHVDIEMTDAREGLSGEQTADWDTQTDQSFTYKLVQPRRTKLGRSRETSRSKSPRKVDKDHNVNMDATTSRCDEDVKVTIGAAQTGPTQPLPQQEDPPKDEARNSHEPRGSDETTSPNHDTAAAPKASHRRIDIQSLLDTQEKDTTPTNLESKRATPSGPAGRRTPAWMLDKVSETSQNTSANPVQKSAAHQEGIETPPDLAASKSADLQSEKETHLATSGPENRSSCADQPSPAQAKSFPDFSIKSILNCCVTPLRKISGLTLSSGPSPRVGDAGSQEMAESPCLRATKTGRDADADIPEENISETTHGAETVESPGRQSAELEQATAGSSGTQRGDHEAVASAGTVGCTTERAGADQVPAPDPSQNVPTFSQQSPWARDRLSDVGVISAKTRANEAIGGDGISSPRAEVDATVVIPAEAQSPWVRNMEVSVAAAFKAASSSKPPSGTKPDNAMESSPAPRPNGARQASAEAQAGPRPSTPEPQFCEASFASFLTPSPVRHSREVKRQSLRGASYQTILASVMKNPWKSAATPRPGRRVSWAPLPHEFKSPCGMRQLLNDDDYEPFSPPGAGKKAERPSSPPPLTPLSQISVSGDTKFQRHFAAVSSRSGPFPADHHQSPKSTCHQRGSPSPDDDHHHPGAAPKTPPAGAEPAAPPLPENTPVAPPGGRAGSESDEGQDPMDMFNELDDFLQTWDVDAELEMARKAVQVANASRARIQAQSPW